MYLSTDLSETSLAVIQLKKFTVLNVHRPLLCCNRPSLRLQFELRVNIDKDFHHIVRTSLRMVWQKPVG